MRFLRGRRHILGRLGVLVPATGDILAVSRLQELILVPVVLGIVGTVIVLRLVEPVGPRHGSRRRDLRHCWGVLREGSRSRSAVLLLMVEVVLRVVLRRLLGDLRVGGVGTRGERRGVVAGLRGRLVKLGGEGGGVVVCLLDGSCRFLAELRRVIVFERSTREVALFRRLYFRDVVVGVELGNFRGLSRVVLGRLALRHVVLGVVLIVSTDRGLSRIILSRLALRCVVLVVVLTVSTDRRLSRIILSRLALRCVVLIVKLIVPVRCGLSRVVLSRFHLRYIVVSTELIISRRRSLSRITFCLLLRKPRGRIVFSGLVVRLFGEIHRIVLRLFLRRLRRGVVLPVVVVVLGGLSARRTVVLLTLLEWSRSAYRVRGSRRVLGLSETVSVVVLLSLTISGFVSFGKTGCTDRARSCRHVTASGKVVDKSGGTTGAVSLRLEILLLPVVILMVIVLGLPVLLLPIALVIVLTSVVRLLTVVVLVVVLRPVIILLPVLVIGILLLAIVLIVVLLLTIALIIVLLLAVILIIVVLDRSVILLLLAITILLLAIILIIVLLLAIVLMIVLLLAIVLMIVLLLAIVLLLTIVLIVVLTIAVLEIVVLLLSILLTISILEIILRRSAILLIIILIIVVLSIVILSRSSLLLPHQFLLLELIIVLVRVDVIIIIIFSFLATILVVKEIRAAGSLKYIPVIVIILVVVVIVVVVVEVVLGPVLPQWGLFLVLVDPLGLVVSIQPGISRLRALKSERFFIFTVFHSF
jgi:hypothetical protein